MNGEYTRIFKAFSDPKRVRILELLCKSEECACVLLDDLNISQPTLSHHMKILCDSGIVTGRKQGRWMYYRIDEDGCEYAGRLLTRLREHRLTDIVEKCSGFYGLFRKPGKLFIREEGQSGCCCCSREGR